MNVGAVADLVAMLVPGDDNARARAASVTGRIGTAASKFMFLRGSNFVRTSGDESLELSQAIGERGWSGLQDVAGLDLVQAAVSDRWNVGPSGFSFRACGGRTVKPEMPTMRSCSPRR